MMAAIPGRPSPLFRQITARVARLVTMRVVLRLAHQTTSSGWLLTVRVPPYYTLDGGHSWNAVSLPGISRWTGFGNYYSNGRWITADRVLANTFYFYYPNVGVFSTTNGGATWTKVYSGSIGPGGLSQLRTVPGKAGNLWFAPGFAGGPGTKYPIGTNLYRSTNGGSLWTATPNVRDVWAIGFGAPSPSGDGYPAVFIVGWVHDVWGIWRSDNADQLQPTWTQIGPWPMASLDQIKTISGDPNIYGQVYIGFAGSGYAMLRPPHRGSEQ